MGARESHGLCSAFPAFAARGASLHSCVNSRIVALLFLCFQGVVLAQEPRWHTDYAKALAHAKAENKRVLLDFTGSDWCEWCIRMDKEVLRTKAFQDYASANLILLEVDFPNSGSQTPTLRTQNENLSSRYGVDGFPTFIVLDKDGKEIGRRSGYLEGGPQAFITMIEKLKKS